MPPASPNPQPPSTSRIVAAGKWLRMDGQKHFLRAVSYGPFKPNARGEPWPEEPRLDQDFAMIRAMGFNTVRVYELPTDAVLDAAIRHSLKLMVGIPWAQHVDVLGWPRWVDDSHRHSAAGRGVELKMREAARRFGNHEAVVALIIGNEIEKTLVRWMEPRRVKRFIEALVRVAKEEAPHCLVSYATYPSTEYLMADNADFLAVNVYLEQREAFEKYVQRLQHLAGNKPLIITEFGVDVRQHGEARQAEVRAWFEDVCQRLGVAGNVWFAFTDEWHRGGEAVTQWQFGLVDELRRARPAGVLPSVIPEPMPYLKISVVVCTRNGSATLRECLEALGRQTYPHREVIVVDDGSTDAVPEIAKSFEFARYHRLQHGGLSVARNAGALLATGEIIAYTDDDCMPDEDWLTQLAQAFDDPQWVAAGGPNIPPPPRNKIEALVAAAPGGPSHVMINDEEAEHLPGCNLAIRKRALEAIRGFNPIFRTAGDDVDVCWWLREYGGRLRFVPGAMVWHHRRFTVKAYFKQQIGYGHAEALLMKQHPQRFGPLGGARWRGAIYGDGVGSHDPVEGSVFHGPQGLGAFQVIYANGGFVWWHWLAGVLWIPLAVMFALLHLTWVSAAIVVGVAWFAWHRMTQTSPMPAAMGDKLLLWFLCLAQPVVREMARLDTMLNIGARPSFRPHLPDILPPRRPRKWSWRIMELAFWSEAGVGREAWLAAFRDGLAVNAMTFRQDDGWRWFDLELNPNRWLSYGIVTVTEYHGGQRMLTRVGVQRRVRRVLVVLLIIWAMIGLTVSIPLLWKQICFGVPVSLAMVWLAAGWVFAEKKMASLIREAAVRAGLAPIKDEGALGLCAGDESRQTN
ncbi:MAG: glycosyltransferase [Verrucomicrobiaceae bacterium]|nr:glycosyltransferase [Verrucomicrobiaceae bacterium]